jgi:serine O-acetyltransferase
MAEVPPELIARLVASRQGYRFPSQLRPLAHTFAAKVLALLFPHFAQSVVLGDEAVLVDVLETKVLISELIRTLAPIQTAPPGVADLFVGQLAGIHALLTEDAEAINEGDPAARSVDEVVLTYPGFLAIAVYRVAHALHAAGLPLVPRLLTEYAHEKTGIDIHPGAHIGRRFCIDHGTGVVIGETTVIGNRVKLYQGVTLGAATVQKELANKRRHPTIEDGVVLYAGATILGGDTVVGHDSIVAGNAWVTQSVPPFSVVNRAGDVKARTSRGGLEDLEFMI